MTTTAHPTVHAERGHRATRGPGAAPGEHTTDYGWVSVLIGMIAVLGSWLPLVGPVLVVAAAAPAVAGLIGRREPSRGPAMIGLLLVGVAVALELLAGEAVRTGTIAQLIVQF